VGADIASPAGYALRTGKAVISKVPCVDVVNIAPEEPHAANVLRIGDALLCAAAHERTVADLRARGYRVTTVDVSELAKAEAGVTCCSLLVE